MEIVMMFFGAVLFGLLASLPALAQKQHWGIVRGFWKTGLHNCLWDLASSELGAVTVSYYAPGLTAGTAVPPTGSQGSNLDTIRAIVTFGVVADAQALITHNMGLSASAAAFQEPQVWLEPVSTTTSWPLLTFDRTNTNVLKVNKPATDAATTVLVSIRRPGGPWR